MQKKFWGATRRPPAPGGFVVTTEDASRPLVKGNTVVRAFCLGCGNGVEIIPSGAEALASEAGVQVPATWEEYFFEADRCPFCNDTYKKVVLRRLSDLKD